MQLCNLELLVSEFSTVVIQLVLSAAAFVSFNLPLALVLERLALMEAIQRYECRCFHAVSA